VTKLETYIDFKNKIKVIKINIMIIFFFCDVTKFVNNFIIHNTRYFDV